jgi:hypothetical protein
MFPNHPAIPPGPQANIYAKLRGFAMKKIKPKRYVERIGTIIYKW